MAQLVISSSSTVVILNLKGEITPGRVIETCAVLSMRKTVSDQLGQCFQEFNSP